MHRYPLCFFFLFLFSFLFDVLSYLGVGPRVLHCMWNQIRFAYSQSLIHRAAVVPLPVLVGVVLIQTPCHSTPLRFQGMVYPPDLSSLKSKKVKVGKQH